MEVRRPRLHQDRTANTSSKRRLMLQTVVLECAGSTKGGCREEEWAQSRQATALGDGERETVSLHLWDEQMCLASLFRKGDGLAIFWPWVMRSDVPDVPAGERGGNNSEHRSLASPSQASEQPTTNSMVFHVSSCRERTKAKAAVRSSYNAALGSCRPLFSQPHYGEHPPLLCFHVLRPQIRIRMV